MDTEPPKTLLLLVCIWQVSSVQPLYIIDTIGLTILPDGTLQSGTLVTLKCQVIISHDNNFNLTHNFQFTRDDILLHSVTTREDTALYELTPARTADSGNYECRVAVGDDRKSSFSKRLNVQGLQIPTLNISKSTLYESEEFVAICSAPDEKGHLIFQFYQREITGETSMIKQTATSGSSSETTLVLRKIGDSFLYCEYEISLVSGNRRSNRSNEIQVMVRGLYISPIMNVLYPYPNIYEGDILEVVCKVVNQSKDVEVFLTRDRRILKRAMISLNHRFTAKEGDSGELVCKARWGNVQKETFQTIKVKSLFSPPQLTMEPKTIFEGDTFKLTCSVTVFVPERINNETMRFFIFKDNVTLTSSATYISVAHPSRNGNYTCQAKASSLPPSPARNFLKDSQRIVIQAKVPVSKPMLRVIGGKLVLGQRFQILCQSVSGTMPITYTLFGPNRTQEKREVRKPGDQAIFNTSAVNKTSDINNILCHAQNTDHKPPMIGSGQILLRSTRIIEPVSKPVLTLLPNNGDVAEGDDLTLICAVDKGSPPYNFTWYHTETRDALFSRTEEKMKVSFAIKAVQRDNTGGYYCVCTNPAHQTKQSSTVMIGVKMASWKKGVIGIICILLILALILAIVFRKGLMRFKTTRSELSVKSAGTKVERLSLTQAEVNQAANVTPGIMGKSIWSDHTSGSESDDQASVKSPERPEPQHPEMQVDPSRGVPQLDDATGSVEYAQLNHDSSPPGCHRKMSEDANVGIEGCANITMADTQA